MAVTSPLPQQDLVDVCSSVGSLWEKLAGKRVLFTGASGFFGSWMLETFLHAGTSLNLPFQALAVTRNARRFSEKHPHLANDPRVEILEGDITHLESPEGPVDILIHSLVPDAGTSLPEMEAFFRSATDSLLAIAVQKSVSSFLLCSTGAVYQPKDPPAPFSEEDPLIPLNGPLSYGQIRRKVEDQCLNAWKEHDLPVKIARGFAFFGPRLPLDGSFAIGNFLRDAMAGGPIVVKGDGSPVRSYLYASDMAAWLWTILIDGPSGRVFNVGSLESITIGDLAYHIGRIFNLAVCLGSKSLPGAAPSCYMPVTVRAEKELVLSSSINQDAGITKTRTWHQPV